MMSTVTDAPALCIRRRGSAFGFVAIVFGSLTVFESIYAATLNVTAATIAAGGLAGAAGLAVVVRSRLPRGPHRSLSAAPGGVNRRRAGWPSRVISLVCALFAVGTLGGLGSKTLSPSAKAGLVAIALALMLVAVDAATGRLATDVRRLRAAARANPRVGGVLYGTLVGGFMLGVFAFGGFVSMNGLRTDGARAPALITNVTHFRATTYFLRYTATGGRTVTCSTENVRGTPRPGSYITVLYERRQPSLDCEDARLGTSFAEPIVLASISVALFIVARWLYGRARRSLNGPVSASPIG
jgi:hypothetical protein